MVISQVFSEPAPSATLAERGMLLDALKAEMTWADPGIFADLISRWLPIARGEPQAADGLVSLARCGSPHWQATTGLAWVEDLIGGCYRALAGRCWLLPGWLGTIRSADHLDQTVPRWRRMVDGLAAAGDNRAARLQQAG